MSQKTNPHTVPAHDGGQQSEMNDYIIQQITDISGDLSSDDIQNKQQLIARMVESSPPRNMIEAMLVSQIIVSHETAMGCLKRANNDDVPDTIRQSELRLAGKYLASVTDQLETLYGYRWKSLEWDIRYERHQSYQEKYSDI